MTSIAHAHVVMMDISNSLLALHQCKHIAVRADV